MNGRLSRAFRETVYEAGDVVCCPGGRSLAGGALLRRWGVREGGFITAWNPRARRRAAGWNARAHRRLAEAVRRYPMRAGISRPFRRLHADWVEAQWLVGAPHQRLRLLGRRFGQRAIVWLRHDGAVRLIWI